jgi:hypothetical protein
MQTTESLKRVGQVTADACTTAARASRDVVGRGVQYVRRNPMKVLVGALATGVLIAWALQHRQQERTFTLPVKKLKNWMVSTAERTGDALHDYKDKAADLADDALTAVRKSARGLRFWS